MAVTLKPTNPNSPKGRKRGGKKKMKEHHKAALKDTLNLLKIGAAATYPILVAGLIYQDIMMGAFIDNCKDAHTSNERLANMNHECYNEIRSMQGEYADLLARWNLHFRVSHYHGEDKEEDILIFH